MSSAHALPDYVTQGSCGHFPRIDIKVPEGWCAGLVVTKKDGLRMPRRIIEVRPNQFLISDMGGWAPQRGRLLSLAVSDKDGSIQVKPLVKNLKRPHGLIKDLNGNIIFAEDDSISIVQSLAPFRSVKLISGLPNDGLHPLKEIVLLGEGEILYSLGSKTDSCAKKGEADEGFSCPELSEEMPRGSVMRLSYDPSSLRVIRHEAFAYGLRNSMGLTIVKEHADLRIFQAENSTDYPEDSEPSEEVNQLVEGGTYGWPYCVTNSLGRVVASKAYPEYDCTRTTPPVFSLPAHAAPLHMIWSESYPTTDGMPWRNSLVLALHGYRESGHRVVSISMAEDRLGEVKDLVSDWGAIEGLRPRGAPTGLTLDSFGRLWIVEDRNGTVIVVQWTTKK